METTRKEQNIQPHSTTDDNYEKFRVTINEVDNHVHIIHSFIYVILTI